MDLGSSLALVDALCTAATIVLVVAGYRAIRRGDVIAHRNRMVAAFVCSAVFLAVFVARFVTFGFRPFPGRGLSRGVYYVLMFAHEPIAVLSVPMVIPTVVLGLLRSTAHVELARPTAVVWLISSCTGVLLYVLLYIVPALGLL